MAPYSKWHENKYDETQHIFKNNQRHRIILIFGIKCVNWSDSILFLITMATHRPRISSRSVQMCRSIVVCQIYVRSELTFEHIIFVIYVATGWEVAHTASSRISEVQ